MHSVTATLTGEGPGKKVEHRCDDWSSSNHLGSWGFHWEIPGNQEHSTGNRDGGWDLRSWGGRRPLCCPGHQFQCSVLTKSQPSPERSMSCPPLHQQIWEELSGCTPFRYAQAQGIECLYQRRVSPGGLASSQISKTIYRGAGGNVNGLFWTLTSWKRWFWDQPIFTGISIKFRTTYKEKFLEGPQSCGIAEVWGVWTSATETCG